jgi:hypothetical protein
MNMRKKIILPLVLALALILPMAAYAATEDPNSATGDAAMNTQETPGTEQTQKDAQMNHSKLHGKKHGHHKHFMKHGFGHGFGKGVHQQMYLSLLAEKYAPDTVDEWEAATAERERLHEELKALHESKRGAKKEFFSADKLTPEMREQMKAQREQMHEQFKLHREVYTKFEEAVKSKDAAQIKSALGELLTVYKSHNEKLAQKIEEWKRQTAAK